MSTTKEPMLSTVRAIFRGLQDYISTILASLPNSAAAQNQLKTSLLEAHQKLREYYYRSDESPFYTRAATLVLDPPYIRGTQRDFASDWSVVANLDSAK
ncbi:hypothetical protein GALMADRAFT_232225 [Galerina marginata CBS 339.88]|uniref:Uncharacterized protein n=1 Tax=Galerina marginata (strain CBS 339.88) TaxID=685588 RepID=A0A067SAL5_GALM3|nr:hypothetical protein GALMADRAFT_232225 [Galerina marginata CBS 339.88]